MEFISNIVFVILLSATAFFFIKRISQVRFNINLGTDLDISDNKSERWKTMLMVAVGQSKMVKRPISGALHIAVYLGFLIINIEVLEIIIDGIFGTHRYLSFLGGLYTFLIATFEIMAVLVLVSCVIFLIRRNVINIKRFHKKEMTSWPKSDANIILIVEILLMAAFLTMNAADLKAGISNVSESAFVVSSNLTSLLPTSAVSLHLLERFCWWFHIIGIFAFLNYIPYSKHFHIMLAFPNVWYGSMQPQGKFTNMQSVTNEVKLMLDPSLTPPTDAVVSKFGVKDVTDLTWKSLMDAYSCTECGRCTDNCPANLTGNELSPRKIMMDTRDRAEELGQLKRKNGNDFEDGKSLFNLIKQEELLACTSCNACVEACPININPLSIILDMRRYMVMEENKAPQEWNMMFTNIENNGAPWAFPSSDRGSWANE